MPWIVHAPATVISGIVKERVESALTHAPVSVLLVRDPSGATRVAEMLLAAEQSTPGVIVTGTDVSPF